MQEPTLNQGLETRRVALNALLAWKRKGTYIQDTLQATAHVLPEVDRGLAWELAFGVCRKERRLSQAIKSYLTGQSPKPEVELIIALGLYQLFFLDRIPQHAAVHVSVDLARKVAGDGATKLVNAILQRSLREGLPKLSSDPVQAMGAEYSIPDWLVAKWMREVHNDAPTVRARLEACRTLPAQWLRVNLQKTTVPELQKALQLEASRTWGDRWIEAGTKVGGLLRSPEFAQGLFSLQNPASDLLVRLLDAKPDERVWDACAAPGGKSALILERCPQVQLVVSDSDARRLESIQDLPDRLGLKVFEIKACDAAHPHFGEIFQRILLDVPCSNLGVMARRPEVPQRLDRKSFEAVAVRQRAILAGAAKCLVPGGVLVYGTCSPEPEETTQVVADFLLNHPDFEKEDAAQFVEAEWVKDGCVQAWNTDLGFDGFFGVRLRRKS